MNSWSTCSTRPPQAYIDALGPSLNARGKPTWYGKLKKQPGNDENAPKASNQGQALVFPTIPASLRLGAKAVGGVAPGKTHQHFTLFTLGSRQSPCTLRTPSRFWYTGKPVELQIAKLLC